MASELWRRSACELAGSIRSGEVSSREVLEAHLARVDTVNPVVHAITEVLVDEARAAADAADAALAAGETVGPLPRVPVTVKVNVDVGGSATTAGMPVFANDRPVADAPVVQRLRAAGAIPFARTNMPDLGLRWHTASALHGVTRNPWDAHRTPGGSSGGEGAAIATGMSPLGIGNDIGGSVRWPSQCCGTVALRPTQGRIPHYDSTVPIETPLAFRLMLTDGPMAREVGDLALALGAVGGADPRDPWSVTAAEARASGPLRVAVTTDPGGLGCDRTIVAGVRRAADLLAAAGCRVEGGRPACGRRGARALGDAPRGRDPDDGPAGGAPAPRGRRAHRHRASDRRLPRGRPRRLHGSACAAAAIVERGTPRIVPIDPRPAAA